MTPLNKSNPSTISHFLHHLSSQRYVGKDKIPDKTKTYGEDVQAWMTTAIDLELPKTKHYQLKKPEKQEL